jgi:hypothetical protein
MKIEFSLDRAGLWWSGLGFNLHIANDRRAADEPAIWWQRSAPSSRSFRLWNLEGVVSRAA